MLQVFRAARPEREVTFPWFRPPAGGRATFSCLCKRRVAKEKHTPVTRPPGILPSGFPALLAGRGPANNSAIPGLRQFAYSPRPAPLLGAPQGPRESAGILPACAANAIGSERIY